MIVSYVRWLCLLYNVSVRMLWVKVRRLCVFVAYEVITVMYVTIFVCMDVRCLLFYVLTIYGFIPILVVIVVCIMLCSYLLFCLFMWLYLFCCLLKV